MYYLKILEGVRVLEGIDRYHPSQSALVSL